MCFYQSGGKENDGYVPVGVGIGGGDYVDFTYCLECGKIQSNQFPVSKETLAEALGEEN